MSEISPTPQSLEPLPEQGPHYELSPEEKQAIEPYENGKEFVVKRSLESGGGYQSGWKFLYVNPQTKQVLVVNEAEKIQKRVGLKTFLEWQKHDFNPENQESKNLNSCRGEIEGSFEVGGSGYIRKISGTMTEVIITKMEEIIGSDGQKHLFIYYKNPDSTDKESQPDEYSIWGKGRLLTQVEYEKLTEEERAAKIFDYLDTELNKNGNKSEKFIDICRSLSKLNLYNLLEKKGIKIENKNAQKILRMSSLSLGITIVLGGCSLTIGAAALGASLPLLVAAKRIFAGAGSTVLVYGSLRKLNEQKNKNLFLNEEQLKAEIDRLKNQLNINAEETTNPEAEETSTPSKKDGVFSKTKEWGGQFLLKRKIKKLEESGDSKILEKTDYAKHALINKLADMQAQRAAALMLDGWNKEQIENDQTYRNISILLEQTSERMLSEDDYSNYEGCAEYLNEVKEEAWQKNFKKEQYKQWGHLFTAAVAGILVGSKLVKNYQNSKTGYFNRTEGQTELTDHVQAHAAETENAPLTKHTPATDQIKTSHQVTTENSAQPKKIEIESSFEGFKELYRGQTVDATIEPGSGEGIIDVLKRQLRANPKMFGFQGELTDVRAIRAWVEAKANNLAFNQGYGEVGVRGDKAIAYLLEPDNHGGFKIVVRDPLSKNIIGAADKINTYEYKIPSTTETETVPTPIEEPLPSAASPELRGVRSVNDLTDTTTSETTPLRGAPLPLDNTISETPIKPAFEEIKPETAPDMSEKVSSTVGAVDKAQPPINEVSNFPNEIPEQQIQTAGTAAGAVEIADTNLTKLNKLIETVDIANISQEKLSQIKTILTTYGKEHLAQGINNLPYSNNPTMTSRAAKLFAQAVSQSKETLKEYVANTPDGSLSAKKALESYTYSLEHPVLPNEIFERWVPVMNPETGEVFNVLKHGKIGGEIEYWLDDNGSGYASKIFNSQEQTENFLAIQKKSLADLVATDMHNKETILTEKGIMTSATMTGELAKNISTDSREIAVDLLYNNKIPDVETFFARIERLIGTELPAKSKQILQHNYQEAINQNTIQKTVDKIDPLSQKIQMEIRNILLSKSKK